MTTPRIKPYKFWNPPLAANQFIHEHRQAKRGDAVARLAALDERIDFGAMAAAVDQTMPRAMPPRS